MHRYVPAAVVSVAFVMPAVAAAIVTPALQGGSCVQQDAGYGLVGAGGKIDPVKLYTFAVEKFRASNLNGRADPSLATFGVTTGDPREWARLFVMVCQQESGCRQAAVNGDGSLQKFSSTLSSEHSYGPLQFNIGEYGLNSWAEVNSPSCDLDAYIRVAQQGKLLSYFGSMKRPSETMQHAGWFNKTIAPYADSTTLTYDPSAAARDYQSVIPYLANPYGTNTNGNNSAAPYSGSAPYYAMQPAGGSPYASASPVPMSYGGGAQSGYAGSSASQQLPIQSQSQQYQSTPVSPFSSITQSTAGSSLQAALNPQASQSSTSIVPGAPAVASLYVQPRSASRTSSILLSWTSLNTKQASCSVSLDTLQLATGEQGSKPIDAKTLPTGTLTFTLACAGADGARVTALDTITVQ